MKHRTRLNVLSLESRVTPSAPIPVGPEFRVNTTTMGSQFFPQTAMTANGDFVVVWNSSPSQEAPRHPYGQRFNAAGVPQGSEFQITDMDLSGFVPNLHVAMDATGDFVVAWVENISGQSYARRFNADGIQQGAEFPIASFATSSHIRDLDMDADGNWAAVWNATLPNSDILVYCRRFDSFGVPLGPEFLVDPPGPSIQEGRQIAMAPNGELVVGWREPGAHFAKRFNSAGQALGPPFQIDAFPLLAGLAINSQGDVVGLWAGDNGVYFRRYASNGNPIGPPVLVSTSTGGIVGDIADIEMDAVGNFIVSWGAPDPQEVFAQAFNADGMRVGGNFQVNTFTEGRQSRTTLAVDADGDVVVVWDSQPLPFTWTSPEGQDGSGIGVYAQRYRRGVPQVQSTQVNDGLAQRSRVTSLSVAFDTKVNFSGPMADAFTLIRNGGKPVSVSFTASAEIVNGRTVVTLSNFAGGSTQFGSLADGRYTLTALSAQITDDYGQHLDGDGDLQQGGNYTFGDNQGLFRFFGDINGDRRVDVADYGLFSLSYLNAANYVAAFDFDGDGQIDIADYGQFSLRYLRPQP